MRTTSTDDNDDLERRFARVSSDRSACDPESVLVRRPRIGLVCPYFTLFDQEMPGLRGSREQAARGYGETLSEHFDVVFPGLVTSDQDAHRANDTLRAEELDAIVLAPSMAAPPSFGLSALESIEVPLVVWNAPTTTRLADDLTQAAATANSTQVGAVMLANPLVRQGRRFTTVSASPLDPAGVQRVVRVVRAAASASVLLDATALRIGEPIPGYLDVETTADELARFGISERSISVEEVEEVFRAVAEEETVALLADIEARGWRRERALTDGRSARLAVAVRHLFEQHEALFGTVNCHSPFFRWNDEIGITACLGVSLLAADGISISCTGDLPTGLTLPLARSLSGRALYCEFYTPELETGLMLLAAGGEGDPAWADPAEPVTVEPNHHYPGTHGAGSGVVFRLEPGPATVMSLSPAPEGWRLAWATGEVVETRYPRMGGPNAMFRFDSGSSYEAGASWIESGATHHQALARGRLDVEIPVLARSLGVREVRV
jgi:L-arabinose isomerase